MPQLPMTIPERISAIEKQITAIKTSQPVGTSNVRTYEIITNNQWDVTYTAVDDLGVGGAAEYVLFEYYADTQLAPFVSLAVIATINGIPYNVLGIPQIMPSPYSQEYITVGEDYSGGVDGRLWIDPDSGVGRVKFRLQMSTPNLGSVFKLKFICRATDRGWIRYRLGQESGWTRG